MTIHVTVINATKKSGTIYIDPDTTTGEDLIVLAEVVLEASMEGLVGMIEPSGNGVTAHSQPIRLDTSKLLKDQGITADGIVVRFNEESSIVPLPCATSCTQHREIHQPADSLQNLLQLFQDGVSGRVRGTGENGGPYINSGDVPAAQKRHQQALPLDPMDPNYQSKLYERIQQENMMTNLEQAIEHTPEAFAPVVMLYIKATVNKSPVTAFVDSGAQMTIMNERTAERCGILRLLDTRMSGVAKGVGTGKILGRIHMTMVNIGGVVLPMSITVLESQDMEFIIGLDQMKRHQMSIDLKKNVLRLTEEVEVSFLSESDIPKRGEDVAESNAREESLKFSRVATVGDDNVPYATTTTAQPQPINNISCFSGGDTVTHSTHMDSLLTTVHHSHTGEMSDSVDGTKETIIEHVMSAAGVNRLTAVGALDAAEWNVDLAVELLIN